uniref:Uncharacterized protein n=1 Tax=Pseudictyota dubia TaxID=2749911 RepID=A0A7R9Z2H2_9STRA
MLNDVGPKIVAPNIPSLPATGSAPVRFLALPPDVPLFLWRTTEDGVRGVGRRAVGGRARSYVTSTDNPSLAECEKGGAGIYVSNFHRHLDPSSVLLGVILRLAASSLLSLSWLTSILRIRTSLRIPPSRPPPPAPPGTSGERV